MAKEKKHAGFWLKSSIIGNVLLNKLCLCFSVVLFLTVQVNGALSHEAVITIDEPSQYTTTPTYFPDLGMSLTKGYSAFPVFFQGWQSTERDEIVSYIWDFGEGTETDHGGRYFEGLNAYHVYETPGIYTASLRVKLSPITYSADRLGAARRCVSPAVVSVIQNLLFG